MINFYDDLFDKKYLDDLSYALMKSSWTADNIANRNTWPYGERGTHLFLGNCFFRKINDNNIIYNTNKQLSDELINLFYYINKKFKKNLELKWISANLQFMGMDGTDHTDGDENTVSYILMLSNEIISEDIGGEFVVLNEKIKYKYGRLIEISANLLHKGLAFNKPNIARMTIRLTGKIRST